MFGALTATQPARAGYNCAERPSYFGGGLDCRRDDGDSWTVTPRPSYFGGGYEKRGTVGGESFSETCTENPSYFGGGYSCR